MYDVIIIGAGIGGMICGCNLAKNGKRVAIFEQHSQVGGCCTSFIRKGFHFDGGAHLFCECSETGCVNVILKKLGIECEFLQFPANEIFYIDNRKYSCPHRKKEFIEYLKKCFQHEASSINRFFLDIKKKENLKVFETISFEELLKEYFDDCHLTKILSAMWLYSGSTPDCLCAADGISIFQSYWKEGAYYPKGGAQKFSDSIAEKFREYGGSLYLSSKVTQVWRKEKGFQIVTGQGKAHEADILVNNGDFKELRKICDRDIDFHSNANQYLKVGKECVSLFSTYWGLTCSNKEELNVSGWYLSEDFSALLVTVPSYYDDTICGKDHFILETFSLDDYTGKDQQQIKIKRKLQSIIPEFDKKADVMEAADWKTIQRYTLNSKGSPYGWEHSIEQGMEKRLDYWIGEDMLQVGHWTQPGSGIKSVIVSGMIASEKIMKKDGVYKCFVQE